MCEAGHRPSWSEAEMGMGWKDLIKHLTLSLEEVNVLKINDEDTGSTVHNITSYPYLARDILFLQCVSGLLYYQLSILLHIL
jgi:hypothetical protein